MSKKLNSIELTILNNILNIVNKHNVNLSKIAIAVSGGADSLFLAIVIKNILNNLCEKLNFNYINIEAIIVNHNLRKNSNNEAIYTSEILNKFDIKSTILNWNDDVKNNLENEARNARYELISNYCKENNIENVFLAHHLDDQIETFLMNLERGSGLDGLCAMPEILNKNNNNINIIRPMLNISKIDIIKYLQEKSIIWIEDESNHDIKFKRNKIRKILQNTIDYDILKKRINNTINILQDVKLITDKSIDNLYENIIQDACYLKNKEYYILFNRNIFNKLLYYEKISILSRIILKFSEKNYKSRLKSTNNIIEIINSDKVTNCTIAKCLIKINDIITIKSLIL